MEFGSEINNGLLKKGMNFDEILCIILRQLGRLLVAYILQKYCLRGFDNCLWASKVALEG